MIELLPRTPLSLLFGKHFGTLPVCSQWGAVVALPLEFVNDSSLVTEDEKCYEKERLR